MAWKGKLIGVLVGYWIMRLPGALIGLYLGYLFDRKVEHVQSYNPFRPMHEGESEALNAALFEAVFAILGHLAKADGRVSEDEIAQAQSLMDRMGLSGDKRKEAIRLFQWGKEPDFPLDDVVARFRDKTRKRKTFVINFLEILLSGALADGQLHPSEEAVLLRVAQGLGIPEAQFRQILSMLMAQARFTQGGFHQGGFGGSGQQGSATNRRGGNLNEAYQVLGIDKDASNAEVKRAYRRLMSQHHPDKLAAKGLGDEAIHMANEKAAKISSAYEMIKEARGFK